MTWKGKHFGVYLTHQSLISEMDFPTYFVDEQLKGQFKNFKHQHFFEQKENYVEVRDLLEYETPFGTAMVIFWLALAGLGGFGFLKNIKAIYQICC